jgi:hypothetical protein
VTTDATQSKRDWLRGSAKAQPKVGD